MTGRAALSDVNAQPYRNRALNTATTTNLGNLLQIGPLQNSHAADTTLPRPVGAASMWKARTGAAAGVGALGLKASATTTNLQLGDVIRWSFWVRSTAPVSFSTYWEQVSGSGGYQGGLAATYSLQQDTWTKVTGSLTVASATHQSMTTIGCGGYSGAFPDGAACYWNGFMVTINQPLPADYHDGSLPGWRWTGTAGASESVGYPYTLESIAGKPLLFVESYASSINNVPLNIVGPYTIATVAKLTAPGGADGLWETQPSRNRRLIGGPTSVSAGGDNGAAGVSSRTYNLDTSTLHSYIHRNTDTNLDLVLDGVVQTPSAPTPLVPLTNPTTAVRIGSRDGSAFPSVTTAALAVWPGYLSDETSKRVAAWLGRRYGAPVPAGY